MEAHTFRTKIYNTNKQSNMKQHNVFKRSNEKEEQGDIIFFNIFKSYSTLWKEKYLFRKRV